ncbi:MAG TPA: hypothetical protein VLT83_04795 [Opitutaceae bacterium]|nr:hypothetical protein [Opitutaceae bacterium]
MTIRLLRPAPIVLTIGGDTYRVDFHRSRLGFEAGGYIAAFLNEPGSGRYLMSELIPSGAALAAAWDTGFEFRPSASEPVDRIINALVRQGLAERMSSG